MQARSKSLIVAAALAALPMSAKAVTMTLSIDQSTSLLTYSTSRTGSYVAIPSADITGNGSALTVTLPSSAVGDYIRFAVDGQLTNTTSGSASSATTGGTQANPSTAVGIDQFSFYATDSTKSVAQIFASSTSNASGTTLTAPMHVNPTFSSAVNTGKSDGNGGIISTAVTTGSQASFPSVYNAGVGSPQNLTQNTSIGILTTGSTTFTITPTLAGTQYAFVSAGFAGGSSATGTAYGAKTLTSADSVAAAPTLTIVVGSAGPVAHPIISLVSSTAGLNSNYGAQVGNSLALVGNNASYTEVSTAVSPAATTGYVAVSGFNPLTDTEVYALKLNLPNGVTDAQVAADINATNEAVGVTAYVASTSAWSKVFPGYDIVLQSTSGFTATGPNGSADLGFDFSQDTAHPGITVTGVAAVPEPATAAGVVLGAAGLLLGRRRKSQLVVA